MSAVARRRRGVRRASLLAACALIVSAPAASAASVTPTDSQTGTTTAASPAPAPAGSSERLDTVADALSRSPLYLDDELTWMLDADQVRSLRRGLRDARVPVLVAVLPSLTEDESGGDTRRVLRTLQQQVGEDGVYITVDDSGRFDLASVGVPLDLGISYSLLSPPYDDRPYEQQEADPRPPGWTTVPDRLRRILQHVRDAPDGTPNGVIAADRIRPLQTLPGHHGPANSTGDIVAAGVFGLFLGLIGAGTLVGVRSAARKSRAASARPRNRRNRRRA